MRLPFPFCILCLLSGTGGKQPQTDNAHGNDASVDHNRKSEGKLDLKMERDGGIMEESSLLAQQESGQVYFLILGTFCACTCETHLERYGDVLKLAYA